MARSFEGGFTASISRGVARNVWHCDIASLYPSVMLQFDCSSNRSASDFSSLADDLRTFRLEGEGKHARGPKRPTINTRAEFSGAANTSDLINSFYAILGFAQGIFADFDAACARDPNRARSAGKNDRMLTSMGAQVI